MGKIKPSYEKIKYKAICSECKFEFYASKSFAQEFGLIEKGSASCPNCNVELNLIFNERTQVMRTRTYKEYLQILKKRNA